jgi:hypothetical protein
MLANSPFYYKPPEKFGHEVSLVANNVDGWRDVSPEAQLVLFSRLSANITAVLRLIQDPNPRAKAATALELQARRHNK